MKIAILQSNYIPWKGYFDIINAVDEFVIYDTVQYTKNDWRNRNKIKTPQGSAWLTIPVIHSTSMKINEVRTSNNVWRKKHWKTLQQNYAKSEYFNDYSGIFEKLYLFSDEMYLSKINYSFITAINEILGIQTRLSRSTDYQLRGDKSEVLVNICKQAGADEYLSGPAARNYLNTKLFAENGIRVTWMDYSGYPEYRQLFPPFDHAVSILDLIFNEGPNAPKYMKSFQ